MLKVRCAETRMEIILNPDYIISISESSRNDGTCYVKMDGDGIHRVVGSADYLFKLIEEAGQDEFFRSPKAAN